MEISVGAVLEGTTKSITKFGAFVTLPGGRSGLVHISEISHSYVANVSDVLSEGQAVKVKVVSIDEAGRINLSMKKAAPPPPRPQGAGRDRQNRPDFRGNSGGTGGRRGSHHPSPARGRDPWAAPQPAGPADFEARLKQFMQASDSKLSDLKMTEKRSSRRGGHRRTRRRLQEFYQQPAGGLAHPGPLRAVFCALWAAEGQGTGDIAPPGAESQRIPP